MCSRTSLNISSLEVLSVVIHEFIGCYGVVVEVSAGEVKLWVMPKTSRSHINDFDHYDVMPN